jgi:predicted ATPase
MVLGMAPGLFVKRIAIDEIDEELADEHPFDLPAVQRFGERRLTSPVTVFVGENGSGKSTLLEALAVALGLNAEGGSRNTRFTTRPSHSELFQSLTVSRSAHRPRDAYFLRAESFYNLASDIEKVDPSHTSYGGNPLHEQSHGESFLNLALERFGGPGIYLLDEPESALSPQRQLALLARMHDLVAAGSQFFLATHAPILMAYPSADVWQFTDEGITSTKPQDTEHWQLLRSFLNDPDNTLDALLQE